jgi:hypothetical protein
VSSIIDETRDALSPLRGLPLWDAGRAATMLWLQLGERVSAPTERDPARVTGEYALHMQCPWRISGRDGIVTGSADMYSPADPELSAWDFDENRPGNAVADRELRRWIDRYAHRPLAVVGIEVDRCGGFALKLSEGFAFEVFPDRVADDLEYGEFWRLLQPARETPHYVMRGVRPGLE